MVKSSDTRIPEDATWADYCDALQAERWSRLLEAQRLNRLRQQKLSAGERHQFERAKIEPSREEQAG